MADESIDKVISEEEFKRLLAPRSVELFEAGGALVEERREVGKAYYSYLEGLAHNLETFLDDHNARNNKTFSYLGEVVASLRWLSATAFTIHHVVARYTTYSPQMDEGESLRFLEASRRVLARLKSWVERLVGEYREEVVSLLGTRERAAFETERRSWEEGIVRYHLPANVDEADITEEEQKVAEVASKYLDAVGVFEGLDVEESEEDGDAVRRLVERWCREERARDHETMVHNIQSKYDTYIMNTALESGNPRLRRLRGHISVCLHLFEAATELVHFYERHENDIRYEPSKVRIARHVQKEEVLGIVYNYAFREAVRFLRAGRGLAEGLIPQYTNVQEVVVSIPEGNWVHIRPAQRIVGIVNHYGTPVEMEVEGEKCQANSILQVMMLMGAHAEAREVRFRGDVKPVGDLWLLFKHGLGEAGELPRELAYLTS